MQLQDPSATAISTTLEQITRCLPIRGGQRLVELGCGCAETTRKIAEMFPDLEIMATEVDEIQHAKNKLIDDLPNVCFQFGGAEEIDLPDQSVDSIVMLKSLHHVPVPLMGKSLDEINRVLVPGGLAFIAEPIYAGEFNRILRIFNDEQEVRAAAFAAIEAAVASGQFELVEQIFFDTLVRFEGFSEYEARILGATHLDIAIAPALREKIKAAFESFTDSNGKAEFRSPTRVDLLRRPA
jgi:SAM-dependent methyltransferase